MAKKLVLSVFDSKIGEFNSPFFMRTRGEALRGWTDVCNDPSTDFHKFSEDYALMEIAEYDEETGKFMNLDAPLNLGLAAQYKKSAMQGLKIAQSDEKEIHVN